MARDLMAKVVVTVPQQMSLSGAVRLLTQAEVSAAPVIDTNGLCVGLLAASAFLPWIASGSETRATMGREFAWFGWQIVEGGANREDKVSDHMQVAPPLIGP